MDNSIEDCRFTHIAKDPRFKRVPTLDRKVKIDKRFQSMFTDDKFRVKYSVDKRGRPVNYSSNENLRKYYALSSDEDDSNDEKGELNDDSAVEDEEPRQYPSPRITAKDDVVEINESHSAQLPSVEQNQESDKRKCKTKRTSSGFKVTEVSFSAPADNKEKIPDKIKEKLRNLDIDYARGESAILSDSSSDDESSNDSVADFEERMAHEWGELDKDAGTTDTTTHRIAVCNMDWDRIRADDLMVLFSSFTPREGFIKSVTIYPSEYGLQRMKEEDVKGPIELVSKNRGDDDEEDDETGEGGSFHMEKLRKYQLNRLKYFYAVVECDSNTTADKIYAECDGLEYESSAIRLDLRFVPDDMTFDQEPKEVCSGVPNPLKYQPRHFVTKALQQAKVDCTWDETNPERVELAEKIMKSNGKVNDEDIKAYLASSSDESEVGGDGKGDADVEIDGNEEERIAKYRALVKDLQEKEKAKSSRDVEMEVTWGIGLKEETEKMVKAKLKGKDELTPFEKYIEKRKEKRKQKKKEKKKAVSKVEEKAFSDDDIPSDVDLNDSYFKEELQGLKKRGKANKKGKDTEYTNDSSDNENTTASRAELELLLMDFETKNHFNINDIMKQENESGKKKKRKGKKKEEEMPIADDFKIDVKDPRFDALYHSHLFNIDPADPHFRKTKAMEALVTEKITRRDEKNTDNLKSSVASESSSKNNAELSMLVKSIKRKAENMKGKKKQKTS